MLNKINLLKRSIWLWLLSIGQNVFAHTSDPWQLNMLPGVTPISKDMYQLHMVAIWVCTVIGIIVFGVMIYSLFKHRKAKGYQAASFHDNKRLEVVWTIIPFLILIGLAIPATQILINMDDSAEADLTVKIVGYQWRWQYSYIDQDISFFSSLSTPFTQIQNKEPKNEWYLLEVDRPLVIPINKKIRFLVTANDVIHSWWVPELGIKRDAIPGFIHEAWVKVEQPGTYRGQCAELCGINHAYMPIVVQAVSQEEFNTWIAQQSKQPLPTDAQLPVNTQAAAPAKIMTRGELMTLGKQKYETVCSACHQLDGKGIPPLYPALKGSSVAVGHPISRHIERVLYGVTGTAMQPYGQQLSDEEVAAIVTYERNAWNNDTDEDVQPSEVAQVRQTNQQQPVKIKAARVGGLQQ